MNVVRTYLSPQGLAALWVMAARSQGEFRWVGWCFSRLGWAGWFKGELVGEWVSAKPNGLLIGINRFRTLFWNDHSHFILKILLEISELNTQITPVSQQPPFQVMLPWIIARDWKSVLEWKCVWLVRWPLGRPIATTRPGRGRQADTWLHGY